MSLHNEMSMADVNSWKYTLFTLLIDSDHDMSPDKFRGHNKTAALYAKFRDAPLFLSGPNIATSKH